MGTMVTMAMLSAAMVRGGAMVQHLAQACTFRQDLHHRIHSAQQHKHKRRQRNMWKLHG